MTSDVDTSGSALLAEATEDSLNVLFARDPEGYSTRDLDRIVEELRKQRERWMAAGGPNPPRVAKATVASKSKLSSVSAVPLDQLDL